MPELIINDKQYMLTLDGFGVRYIDGVELNEWMKTIDAETLAFLVKKGTDVVKNEPEHFEDIAEREEMPMSTRDLMRHYGKTGEIKT